MPPLKPRTSTNVHKPYEPEGEGIAGPALMQCDSIVGGLDAVGACVKEHGVVKSHLPILANLAECHDVVFAFRPVNHLATQLIEQGYPTKDLRIKGKSADWGPMAGFIPVSQAFSKLVGNSNEIEKMDAQIQKCLIDKHAVSIQLAIDHARLSALISDGEIETKGELGREHIQIVCEKNSECFVFDGKRVCQHDVETYEISHQGLAINVLAKTNAITNVIQPLTADYDLLMFAAPLEAHDLQNSYGTSSNSLDSSVYEHLHKMLYVRTRDLGAAEGNHKPGLQLAQANGASCGLDDISNNVPCRGFVSDRLESFIPVINQALGRGAHNEVVQHGADTQNPNSVMTDNYPFIIFAPKNLGGFDGIAMARNNDEAIAIYQVIKEGGYQFFGNEKWTAQFPRANYQRTSVNEALKNFKRKLAEHPGSKSL